MDHIIQYELRLADSRLLNNPYRETALFSRLAEHLKRQEFEGHQPRRVGVSGCAGTPKMYFTFPNEMIPPVDRKELNEHIKKYIETTSIEEYGFRWDLQEPNVLVVYMRSER